MRAVAAGTQRAGMSLAKRAARMPILSCRRYVVAAALLAGAVPAQHAKVALTPTIYPAGATTRHGDAVWHTARVLDAATGLPLRDAELLFVAEREHPLRGELWWERRATADAEGFVRMRGDPGAPDHAPWAWTIVRAPGHGAVIEMEAMAEPLLPLSALPPLPVRVRNLRGEVVPDALLGFCGGCGHTPDVASGRTDATGLVLLADVDFAADGDLYVEHPELALGYVGVDWRPGEPPFELVVEPGRPATGVVVDAAGKPLPGVFVGTLDVHRGPWTRTGPDGAFRLCGANWTTSLFVGDGTRVVDFALPAQQPFRLQMPPSNGNRRQVVELPAGVRAADEPDAAGTDTEPAEPRPSCRVRVLDLPTGGTVLLRSATTRQELDRAVAAGAPIELPAEPFDIVLEGGRGQRRVFAWPDARAIADTTVRLRWFAPTRVEGRLVDPDGRPLPARLVLRPIADAVEPPAAGDGQHSEGAFSLATDAVGLHLLVVDAPSVTGLRSLPIVLPPRGDEVVVDVGEIVLGGPPRLQVLDEHGEPIAEERVRVGLIRAGWHDARRPAPVFGLDPHGAWCGPEPRAGDAIEVRSATPVDDEAEQAAVASGARPTRELRGLFPLAGAGPWTLRLHGGAIDLDLRTEHGRPLTASVFVGTEHVEAHDRVRLRGVPAGRQRLFVAAHDRLSAIVDVDVPTTGTIAVEVMLPRR